MPQIPFTGPDGITRMVDLPMQAPNFIADALGGVQRGGLPTPYSPNLPVPYQAPGVPATVPYQPNFSLGEGGPVEFTGVGRPGPLGISGPVATAPPAIEAAIPAAEEVAKKGLLGRGFGAIGGLVKSPITWGLTGLTAADKMMGADPAEGQFGTGPLSPYTTGKLLKDKANSDETTNLGGYVYDTLGNLLQAPERVMTGLGNWEHKVVNNALMTKGEQKQLADEEAARQKQQQDLLNEQAQAEVGPQDAAIMGLLGGVADEGGIPKEGISLGKADTGFQGFQIPPPPPGMDYSGVQDIIDKTKPVDPTRDLEARKRGAVITGLIGGMLNAAMNGDGNFAQVLGGAGQGVLTGLAEAAKDDTKSRDEFKQAMDQYWLRTAGVKQNQMESDHDYSLRVYDTKLKQLEVNARVAEAKAKAGEVQLLSEGGKFYTKSVVNGQLMLKPIDMGLPQRGAQMIKAMTPLLGGDEHKANALVAEMMNSADPQNGLAMFTVAKLHDKGAADNFASTLGPKFWEAYQQAGNSSVSLLNADPQEKEKAARAERDALLMAVIATNPAIRTEAYRYSGLTNYMGK